MEKVAKVHRRSLTHRAADAIRDAILTGGYPAGQKLREATLADDLGVSRSVIREALLKVEGMGLVHSNDYQGKSVRVSDLEEIVTMIPLRIALESLAAAAAARNVTPEFAEALQNQVSRFLRPMDSYSTYAQIDFELHKSIWEAARNRVMADVLQRLAWPLLIVPAHFSQSHLADLVAIEKEGYPGSHRPIVEAICAGDPRLACVSMREHFAPAFSTGWYMKDSVKAQLDPTIFTAISDAGRMVEGLASDLGCPVPVTGPPASQSGEGKT
jgi:DNA-binding GntR family transcriptional regulator